MKHEGTRTTEAIDERTSMRQLGASIKKGGERKSEEKRGMTKRLGDTG